MWKSLASTFKFGGPGESEEEKEVFNDEFDEYDSDQEKVHYAEAQLLSSESEKKHLLTMFHVMRKDSFFCDVAFVCNGVMFRAHRVVVSSWSRWLRALLCESPDDEVIALDFFDATALGAALDYMYGVPLTITVDTADNILKVVRRLEMQKLEQQCWRYLMTVIDPLTNCEKLHELADRYDCPPLKLAAWRILQETKPGYGASMAASRLLKQGRQGLMQASLGVTGLTGPGEPWFNISSRAVPPKVEGEEEKEEVESEDEDEARYFPSVFSELREAEEKELRALEGEEEADSDDDNDDDDSAYRERKNKFGWDGNTYPDPAQLDLNASAAQVVQAWAFRLKDVYDKCMPQDASEFEDVDDFMIPRNSPHVRLTTAYRPHGHHGQAIARKRSDLLGEPEEEAPRPPDDPTFVLVPASPVRRPPPATPANTGAPGYVGKPWSNSAKGFPGAGGVVISPRTVDWREELKRFYMSVGLPEKILGIPTILKTWANKEEQMLSALMERYEESIPPQMMHHLETLLAQLDAHTESSFVREKAKKGVVKVGTGEEGKASGRIAREREKEAKKGVRKAPRPLNSPKVNV